MNQKKSAYFSWKELSHLLLLDEDDFFTFSLRSFSQALVVLLVELTDGTRSVTSFNEWRALFHFFKLNWYIYSKQYEQTTWKLNTTYQRTYKIFLIISPNPYPIKKLLYYCNFGRFLCEFPMIFFAIFPDYSMCNWALVFESK